MDDQAGIPRQPADPRADLIALAEHARAEAVRPSGPDAAAVDDHMRHHLTDGRWHDDCPYCIRRRTEAGTGVGRPSGPDRAETRASQPRCLCEFLGDRLVSPCPNHPAAEAGRG